MKHIIWVINEPHKVTREYLPPHSNYLKKNLVMEDKKT